MKIHVVAVGKQKAGPEKELVERYARQLPWELTFHEVEEKRNLPPEAKQLKEAELLSAALPVGAKRIVLDERGKQLTSQQLAAKLGSFRDEGFSTVAFLIGGADGHVDTTRKSADLVLSLSTLTWPHMLVRAMLAEQLYRAYAILSGHPYHRE